MKTAWLYVVRDDGVSRELGESVYMLKSHLDAGTVFTANPHQAKTWKMYSGARRWAEKDWAYSKCKDFTIVRVCNG